MARASCKGFSAESSDSGVAPGVKAGSCGSQVTRAPRRS